MFVGAEYCRSVCQSVLYYLCQTLFSCFFDDPGLAGSSVPSIDSRGRRKLLVHAAGDGAYVMERARWDCRVTCPVVGSLLDHSPQRPGESEYYR